MSQLLTFTPERYCRLAARFSAEGLRPGVLGEEGMLNIFLVQHAGAAASHSRLPPEGSIIVAAAPFSFAPAGPCHIIGVGLTGAAADEMRENLAGYDGFFVPGAADGGRVLAVASALRRLADPSFGGEVRQSALGYEILCRLARLPAGERAVPPLVGAAIGLIRAHYAEVYGVEELATELGVSKGHLIRSFSAATGLSPGRYLTATRIEAAKTLLVHRDYPLEVVAGLCGFSGAGYFCRVFKREEGVTPSAWRDANMPPEKSLLPEIPHSEWEDSLYL